MNAGVSRATLLVNREARGAGRFEAQRALRYLERRGVDARLIEPASPGDTREAAREAAARGDDLLFVLGGDGTLRVAAEGLAGSRTALAALPGGTVNVWVKEVGIPRKARAAIDSHLRGQVATVDLARANGQAFLLMAGVGWDAAVASGVSGRWKRRLADVAYMLRGVAMAPRLRTVDARWAADGVAMEGRLALMVVGNTRLYGGRVCFTPEALVDDGLLDFVALCPGGVVDAVRLSWLVVGGGLAEDRCVIVGRAREVEVETAGLPYQLDGDVVGETPVRFGVDAGALRVSLPAGPLPAMFGRSI